MTLDNTPESTEYMVDGLGGTKTVSSSMVALESAIAAEPEKRVCKPSRNWSMVLVLVMLAATLILSRALHVLLAQPFKRELLGGTTDLRVPYYHATLEASSFPLSILFWVVISLRKYGKVTVKNPWYRLKMYGAMALVDSINSVVAAVGLNNLPAAVYTILKASSIIFSVIFSRLLTSKEFNFYHYFGVIALFLSTTILSCSSAMNWETPEGFNWQSFYGMLGCLCSSLCLAFLGVLTYRTFVHEKCKGDIVVVAENNAFQATMMFFFLLPLLATKEAQSWPDILEKIRENGTTDLFVGLSLGMLLCRPLSEFAGIAITAFSSPVLTRALGGPRRILIVTVSFFRGEHIGVEKLISMVCLCIGLAIYVYGGHVLQLQKKKRESGAKAGQAVTKAVNV